MGAGGGADGDGEFAAGRFVDGGFGVGDTGAGETGEEMTLPPGRGKSSLSIPDFPPALCASCVIKRGGSAAKSGAVMVRRKLADRAEIEESLTSEAIIRNHAFLSGGRRGNVPRS